MAHNGKVRFNCDYTTKNLRIMFFLTSLCGMKLFLKFFTHLLDIKGRYKKHIGSAFVECCAHSLLLEQGAHFKNYRQRCLKNALCSEPSWRTDPVEKICFDEDHVYLEKKPPSQPHSIIT